MLLLNNNSASNAYSSLEKDVNSAKKVGALEQSIDFSQIAEQYKVTSGAIDTMYQF